MSNKKALSEVKLNIKMIKFKKKVTVMVDLYFDAKYFTV